MANEALDEESGESWSHDHSESLGSKDYKITVEHDHHNHVSSKDSNAQSEDNLRDEEQIVEWTIRKKIA
eukprot:CAMPEP_0172480356 /NCGR_PEP_ID=MMETSP1066-20121228/5459_1 /TAXON_ID=671091 /ORGANISM="Coscinodiscus wailesii, Strain CCMP2513" /LENGTH=68 /DNA_ID=CAMNT_0013241575 /DNA_START=361 /DNA_END=570 /DNA_ORIENTATION=+